VKLLDACLIFAATIIFASEPAKTQTAGGPPKGKGAQISQQTATAKAENAAKGASPKSEMATVSDNQAKTARNNTATEHLDENIEIQRKLARFTGMLVVVGFLQALVLIWQACVFGKTLKAISRQATIMLAQSSILKKSVTVARQNTEIYISKERARLRVEVEPLDLQNLARPEGEGPPPRGAWFKVIIEGFTPAFITETRAVAMLSGSKEPPPTNLTDIAMGELPKIPQVIKPGSTPVETFALIQPEPRLTLPMIQAIQEGKSFVHFWGFIHYKDVFDRERRTRFRYLWDADAEIEAMYGISKADFGITPQPTWIHCGPREDNIQT
jgi:hypothetical protein